MHYSAANSTATPRRAYIMGAACPSRPLPPGAALAKPWQLAERSVVAWGDTVILRYR
jgi:hypothetical protein